MNEKTKEFLELVKQNPDLPIVPMVAREVVTDEGYSNWLGSFRGASVDEYVSVEIYGDNVFFTRDEQSEIEEHFANQIANEISRGIFQQMSILEVLRINEKGRQS